MTILRKIFFYIFAVIYIIFCPLIVLCAMGYGMEKGVVKTGLIAIDTAPPRAEKYKETEWENLIPEILEAEGTPGIGKYGIEEK